MSNYPERFTRNIPQGESAPSGPRGIPTRRRAAVPKISTRATSRRVKAACPPRQTCIFAGVYPCQHRGKVGHGYDTTWGNGKCQTKECKNPQAGAWSPFPFWLTPCGWKGGSLEEPLRSGWPCTSYRAETREAKKKGVTKWQ